MKQKLLAFALFLITAIASAQVTANPVPNITLCNVPGQTPGVNLTSQIPLVLGNQDPQMHMVTFHTSMADALSGAAPIGNITSFIPTSNPQMIYIRVNMLQDIGHDVTSFSIIYETLGMPTEDFWANCSSYTLPPLTPVGTGVISEYRTAPNGGGSIIPEGTVITQSTIIYIYTATANCSVNTTLHIDIWNIPPGNPAPYLLCTANGTPATFDLTSRIPALAGQNQWAMVSFHLTQADASNNTGAIANLQAYTATSAMHTIYARIMIDGTPICYWYKPLVLVTETCTNNQVSGTVRFDVDGGGCASANDVPAQGIPVYNIAGPNTYQTFSDANGNYSFSGTPDGANVVLITQTQQQYAITPAAHNVPLPGIVTGKDFCLSVPNPVQDVAVTLIPVTQARPGMPVSYSLVYSNVGTLPATGSVSVYFPIAKMSYVSSSPAMSVSGNVLTMTYTNLQPLQSRHIYITFLVQPPQVVPLGDVLTSAAVITLNGTEANQGDNVGVVNQTVVNSYDPNDISVLEGAIITEAQADGYLHYTIRFQNIGNADALRVRIENMLDSKFNYATLQPLSASHPYHFERKNDKLTIRFDNINLPGSQVNEPASHGYITYRVKPNATVGIGDSMSNNANIYFDFNDPIITNTVTTTVQAPAGMADFAASGFAMYPNPSHGTVTLKFAEELNADVTVRDVLGKTVLASKVTTQEQSLDIAALNTGIYFVKVTSKGQSATKKLVVK